MKSHIIVISFCTSLFALVGASVADEALKEEEAKASPVCITIENMSSTWCLRDLSNEVTGAGMIGIAAKANDITGGINSAQITQKQLDKYIERKFGNYLTKGQLKSLSGKARVLSGSTGSKAGIVILFVGGAGTMLKDAIIESEQSSADLEMLEVGID